MATTINYNGSRFLGGKPASIESLLKIMKLEQLDKDMIGVNITEDGSIRISGNFIRVAHAFSITTDEKDVLASFAAGLEVNRRLPDPTKDVALETMNLMKEQA